MAEAVEEARRRAGRARQAGLFRYQLIQDVTGPGLSARQRGALVRELAGREHDGPAGQKIVVSEQTIRRWIRDWRAGGFEALVPAPAPVSARTPAEVLELAVALKKENPLRTAAQVTRILRPPPDNPPGHRRPDQQHDHGDRADRALRPGHWRVSDRRPAHQAGCRRTPHHLRRLPPRMELRHQARRHAITIRSYFVASP